MTDRVWWRRVELGQHTPYCEIMFYISLAHHSLNISTPGKYIVETVCDMSNVIPTTADTWSSVAVASVASSTNTITLPIIYCKHQFPCFSDPYSGSALHLKLLRRFAKRIRKHL